jgi:dipeptidyl aminopeptidase/acylaminoacyl peptidase
VQKAEKGMPFCPPESRFLTRIISGFEEWKFIASLSAISRPRVRMCVGFHKKTSPMKKFFLLIVLAFANMLVCAQQVSEFISHPIASALAGTVDGKRIAWVLNHSGNRNIYFQDGSGPIAALTNYTGDDGQEISELTFSPDGNQLLFVRGGSANRAGQFPNPASLAEGAEQAIWLIELQNANKLTRMARGYRPRFLPDGKKIIFQHGGQIQTLETAKPGNGIPLFHARGSNQIAEVSPDGKQLLFTSNRGDHHFVGVYHFDTQRIRWIAPEVGRDQHPVWSPDGKQIAFIRQPGLKAGELLNLLGGTSFSVWVADTESGTAKKIWQSPADDGGFAQHYPAPALAWSRANRILFFSEHTGWLHVFSVNPDGSDVRDITPGDGEVESFALSPDGRTLYFDGNRTDIDRRHIWKNDVRGGTPVAVTAGSNIEMYPQWVGNQLYAFQSGVNFSKTLVRISESNKKVEKVLPALPSDFRPALFVEPQQVVMKAPDGTTIHGQLFLKKGSRAKAPGIVFMHGGPIRQMLLGFHYSDYYINTYAFNQFLAQQGYAVISVNFRCGTGYGRSFRRATNAGPRGASEYQDVVTAARYLQSMPEVDAARIGLWGGSYGGYLTAMGLARNPEIFKAGVDLHGVHDWAFRAREFSPGGGWGITADDMELAYQSSPVADLSKWTSPVLIVHGDDDRNVLYQQSTDLAERLRARNVSVELLALPDEVHGFLRYESWKQVFEAAHRFFDRTLK